MYVLFTELSPRTVRIVRVAFAYRATGAAASTSSHHRARYYSRARNRFLGLLSWVSPRPRRSRRHRLSPPVSLWRGAWSSAASASVPYFSLSPSPSLSLSLSFLVRSVLSWINPPSPRFLFLLCSSVNHSHSRLPTSESRSPNPNDRVPKEGPETVTTTTTLLEQ